MKYKVLLLSIALLSCFTALLYTLSNVASAGVGCGTNWMGDTTGDTDFYVSKNQNLGTSSDTGSSGAMAAAKPAVALGSTATKAVQSAGIDSLTPNAASPQKPGAAIVWTASATGSEPLFYDFLLRGPATDGLQTDKTGWIARNSWTWNTTNADAGENQVEVRIKYASSKDAIASKTGSFTISLTAQSGAAADDSGTASSETVSSGPAQSSDKATATAVDETAAAADTHPASKTASVTDSKPRISPDERTKQTSTDITGPNMNMPDPSPKTQNTAETVQTATQAAPPVATYAETAEPKVMEVDGKWSVRLVNAASSMDLILIQTGKSISGWGNLEEKNTKLPLIATGSVSDNSINLDVKTVVGEYVNKIDKRFKLDLVKVDRVVSGSYEEYSGEDITGTGNATASRI